MTQPLLPAFDDITAAAAQIADHALRTPLLESPLLSQRVGRTVLIKPETLQRVGAFKFRGAYNKIAQIDRAQWPGGVVACSSGNHAQGVAEAARLCGLAAVIVMPSDAPALKVARTKRSGAQVVFYNRDTEDRNAIAHALAQERQAVFVAPFDDPDIIAGQGTVGLEIVEQAEALGTGLDAVLVPCSGGGLVSGIAIAMGHLEPEAKIYAVEPEGFDDLRRSLQSGRRERNNASSGSICDALLIETPGELTFEILRKRLAGAFAVSDAEVREAVRFAFEELKLVVEPGGAAALAALLAGRLEEDSGTVAVVLSGGNVDAGLFAEIIGGQEEHSA